MTGVPIRHSTVSRLTARGITPRRLAAANRALQRERDHLPLFAEQIAAEQPTAEERVEEADRQLLQYAQSQRDLAALHWNRGRQWLQQIPAETRAEIIALWNQRTCPPTAAYFCDFVRGELKRRGFPLDSDT